MLLLLLPRRDDGERPLPPDHHCRIIIQKARVEYGRAGGLDEVAGEDCSAHGGRDARLDHEEDEDIDGEGLKER